MHLGIPQLSILPRPNPVGMAIGSASFWAPLKSTLNLAVGVGSPTYTRATTATVFGYAEAAVSGASQTLLTIPAGIPRFSGARFVASSNTWSEVLADGTPIPDSQLLGYLSEGAATNYFLNSGSPATQTISLGTGTYTMWLTGTGSVAIAAGTATITGAGTATSAAPLTFTVTVAGTVTATVTGTVTTAQLENTAFPTSYIATAGAAVTRNADVLTYAANGNISGSAGTAYAEVKVSWTTSPAATFVGGDTANDLFLYRGLGGAPTSVSIYDGTTVTTSGVSASYTNTSAKMASSWGGTSKSVTMNGLAPVVGAFDGGISAATYLAMGNVGSGASPSGGNIRNVRIWQQQLSNATLQAITT